VGILLLVLRPYHIKSGTRAGHLEYQIKLDDDEGLQNVRHFTLVGCAWTDSFHRYLHPVALEATYEIWEKGHADNYEVNKWPKTIAWIH
jgi:hypothetical protein